MSACKHDSDILVILGFGSIMNHFELMREQVVHRRDAQDIAVGLVRLAYATVLHPPPKNDNLIGAPMQSTLTVNVSLSFCNTDAPSSQAISRSRLRFCSPSRSTSEKKPKSTDWRCPKQSAIAVPPYRTKWSGT